MRVIRIIDDSNFVTGKERNGGNYKYEEVAILDESGVILRGEHTTSAEFQFCTFCGSFGCTECTWYHPSYEMDNLAKRTQHEPTEMS